MLLNWILLPFSVKHPRSRMRNIEQFKQSGLFDLILNALIGVITWKGGFAHGVEKICIKCGGVINFVGCADELRFLGAVIGKI